LLFPSWILPSIVPKELFLVSNKYCKKCNNVAVVSSTVFSGWPSLFGGLIWSGSGFIFMLLLCLFVVACDLAAALLVCCSQICRCKVVGFLLFGGPFCGLLKLRCFLANLVAISSFVFPFGQLFCGGFVLCFLLCCCLWDWVWLRICDLFLWWCDSKTRKGLVLLTRKGLVTDVLYSSLDLSSYTCLLLCLVVWYFRFTDIPDLLRSAGFEWPWLLSL